MTDRARPRVMAIAIDGPNHDLLLQWMAEGRLPHLARLRERSAAWTIESSKKFSNEHCWIPVLTGRASHRWNHWLDQWDPQAYRYDEASIMDWLDAPLFYALGDQRTVVSFDLAAPVVAGVKGVQVSGWASELNESFPQSDPPGLLAELLRQHGPDPKVETSAMTVTNQVSMRQAVSHIVPVLYDEGLLEGYAQGQVRSAQRRVEACSDVLARTDWDLFITAFSETHTAGHVLWHMSRPHPLGVVRSGEVDLMLATYQAVDRSIGALTQLAAPGDFVVVFSLDEIGPDCLENARAVLLPEFLYRWNFAGQAALAEGDPAAPTPEPRLGLRRHWKHEVWDLRTPAGHRDLESPAAQESRQDAMSWCPANWYRPVWRRMRAFALPSVADGYVRINVIGREAEGIVAPADYGAVCDELARDLRGMSNARTGKPLVRDVIRVRGSPFDDDPKKTPADLIVVFHEDGPVDTADSPHAGRIGPVPYFRSGSHPAHGTILRNFMYVSGPGVEPGARGTVARIEDIPATLLALLGVDIPAQFDGVPRL